MRITFAAAIAAVLLGAAPAFAEAPVKVDPSQIEKLTAENAPKPSLSERLSRALSGDEAGSTPSVDPSETKGPTVKAPEPKLPPSSAPLVKKVDEKPVDLGTKPVETKIVPPPKNIDARIFDQPVKAQSENDTAGSDKISNTAKEKSEAGAKQTTKPNQSPHANKSSAQKESPPTEVAPAATTAPVAEPKEESEPSGLRKYLPW